jgi:outer membrane protein assembly factor BamD (BamD/ComL family)
MKRLDAALEKFRTLMLTYPNSPLAPKAKQIAEAIEKKLSGASASAAPAAKSE